MSGIPVVVTGGVPGVPRVVTGSRRRVVVGYGVPGGVLVAIPGQRRKLSDDSSRGSSGSSSDSTPSPPSYSGAPSRDDLVKNYGSTTTASTGDDSAIKLALADRLGEIESQVPSWYEAKMKADRCKNRLRTFAYEKYKNRRTGQLPANVERLLGEVLTMAGY